MPMKNAHKKFIEGGIYHVYNRGVNKQPIFFEDSDFNIFLGLLDRYILGNSPDFYHDTKNYRGRISLLAFCLLNNHIHLLVQQKDKKALTGFMHSLMTSFTMRINKKYDRVGHLFQGIYKARLIENDEDLLNVSKYIHTNGGDDEIDFFHYPFSSVRVYLGRTWEYLFVDPRIISGLSPAADYREFLLASEKRAQPLEG
jgi:REP element-mobilizing transposase RayT